jgi:hypothetical protein
MVAAVDADAAAASSTSLRSSAPNRSILLTSSPFSSSPRPAYQKRKRNQKQLEINKSKKEKEENEKPITDDDNETEMRMEKKGEGKERKKKEKKRSRPIRRMGWRIRGLRVLLCLSASLITFESNRCQSSSLLSRRSH